MSKAIFADFVKAKDGKEYVKLISMVAFSGRLIIATETSLYEVKDGTLEELKFEMKEPPK